MSGLAAGRVRRAGAGRPSLAGWDPTVVEDLERLVCPATRGDPERPLRWTSKSAAKLADGLRGLGHEIVDRSVLRLLGRLGYTMQANVKTREGAEHPDRDAQFEHINDTVAAALAASQPVISVDTKKKELVGEFKAVGREWAPSGEPVEVNTHDFPSHAKGKAIPYGVYDLARNKGWIASASAATPPSSRPRRSSPGGSSSAPPAYPDASHADDHRGLRRLQQRPRPAVEDRAAEARRPDRPADPWSATSRPAPANGTASSTACSSFVSHNWRGKPLIDYATIINLIASTTTSTGLKVYARLDETDYPKGIKVSDAELADVNIQRARVPRRLELHHHTHDHDSNKVVSP